MSSLHLKSSSVTDFGGFPEESANNIVMAQKDIRSVRELLKWVNKLMNCDVKEISELRSGSIYCQIMHKLYPDLMPLSKVYMYTNAMHEMESNFNLIRCVFIKLNIIKDLSDSDLAKGRGHYEFLNWLHKFHKVNSNGEPYDALLERNSEPIGLKPNYEGARRADNPGSLRRNNTILFTNATQLDPTTRSQSLLVVQDKLVKTKSPGAKDNDSPNEKTTTNQSQAMAKPSQAGVEAAVASKTLLRKTFSGFKSKPSSNADESSQADSESVQVRAKPMPPTRTNPAQKKTESFAKKAEALLRKSQPFLKRGESFLSKTELFEKKSEPFLKKSETFLKKSEPYLKKSETFLRKSETFLKKTETFKKKMLSVQMKMASVEKKPVNPESEPVNRKSEPIKPESEPDDPKLEFVKPKSETIKPKSETIKPKSEPVKPKWEPFKPKLESTKTTLEFIKPKPESIKSKSEFIKPESLKPKSVSIKPKPESVKPKWERFKSNAETIKTKSEPVEPKSEPAEPKSEPIEPKSKSVELISDLVEPKSKPIEPKSETSKVGLESIQNKPELMINVEGQTAPAIPLKMEPAQMTPLAIKGFRGPIGQTPSKRIHLKRFQRKESASPAANLKPAQRRLNAMRDAETLEQIATDTLLAACEPIRLVGLPPLGNMSLLKFPEQINLKSILEPIEPTKPVQQTESVSSFPQNENYSPEPVAAEPIALNTLPESSGVTASTESMAESELIATASKRANSKPKKTQKKKKTQARSELLMMNLAPVEDASTSANYVPTVATATEVLQFLPVHEPTRSLPESLPTMTAQSCDESLALTHTPATIVPTPSAKCRQITAELLTQGIGDLRDSQLSLPGYEGVGTIVVEPHDTHPLPSSSRTINIDITTDECRFVQLPSDSDSEDDIDDRVWNTRRQISLLKDKLTTVECIVMKYCSNSQVVIKKLKRYFRKQQVDEPFVLGNF